jgi:uncharacterized protein YigA (DUF484 family)
MSEQLKILITANLDIGKSEKELQRQLSTISEKLSLSVGIDTKQVESLSNQVGKIQEQLSGKKVQLIDESDIANGKKFYKDIENIKDQFRELGTVSVSKVFDTVTGDVKQLNVEIQKADGLIEKLKLEAAQLKGIEGIDNGYLLTNRQEIDKTSLQMEKALQQTIQNRQKDEKKLAETQAKAANKNLEDTQKEIQKEKELKVELQKTLELYQRQAEINATNLSRRYKDSIDGGALEQYLNNVKRLSTETPELKNKMDHLALSFKEIGANARTSASHTISFGEQLSIAMSRFPIDKIRHFKQVGVKLL